jgi:hypothetical protein
VAWCLGEPPLLCIAVPRGPEATSGPRGPARRPCAGRGGQGQRARRLSLFNVAGGPRKATSTEKGQEGGTENAENPICMRPKGRDVAFQEARWVAGALKCPTRAQDAEQDNSPKLANR